MHVVVHCHVVTHRRNWFVRDLVALETDCFDYDRDEIDPESWAGQTVWWAVERSDPKRMVGMVRVDDKNHIHALCVAKDVRKKGIGTLLLSHVLNDIGNVDVTLIVGTDWDHDELVSFYRNFGFTPLLKKSPWGNTVMLKSKRD